MPQQGTWFAQLSPVIEHAPPSIFPLLDVLVLVEVLLVLVDVLLVLVDVLLVLVDVLLVLVLVDVLLGPVELPLVLVEVPVLFVDDELDCVPPAPLLEVSLGFPEHAAAGKSAR